MEAQQVALSGGVEDLIHAWKRKGVLRASLVEVGEVDAHTLHSAFLGDDDQVRQPFRVPHLPNDTSLL